MRLSLTLSKYLSRHFFFWLISVFLAFASITLILDTVELMRRASGKEDATLDVVVQMGFLKLPYMLHSLLPFIILFGALLAFWRLARTNEVVVARAAGISAWQFLLPIVGITFLIGVFEVGGFNPFASAMLSKYESLEARFLKRKTSMLAVSKNGLWLRQADGPYQSVIHALRVSQANMMLHDVIIFRFEGKDKFSERIDASRAKLGDKHWKLENAWISTPLGQPKYRATYEIPTNLTITKIQESFASPETMSSWDLPEFIETMEAAGFSGHRHRLHFQSLLAFPILLCAMILIAASFTLRVNRRTGARFAIIGSVVFCFVIYFLSDVIQALGMSATIPSALAAWTPACVSVMIGLALLFHLEDG
jgi:lipopolysaccharide export system permease protein